jgi:SOS-response transcriptional repressor LexA
MTKPQRRPLTAEEKAEAQRLKAAWTQFKYARQMEGDPVTQQWLADQCGWSGQSAVSQFLNGTTPLNLDALMKICAAIGNDPKRISARLTMFSQEQMAGYGANNPDQVQSSPAGDTPALHGRATSLSACPLISWAEVASFSHMDTSTHPAIPCPVPHSPSTFVLEVQGTSNSSRDGRTFDDGNLIFVDPEATPRAECGVVLTLDGQKQPILRWMVSEGENRYIRALNPDHPDRALQALPSGTIIHGIVIARLEPL